ncbi:hypothetical protein GCM10012278_79280 [Nonomuraea glycinis]|uniref:Uncharacterized protein n=1 Tax=Nonomuraea glycinis TaxID=2047744 RepID=A0A918ACN7_9ACTN|nr:hypothetical protein GCM10012278_79280 [Nonomuraea glycinis]
MASEAFRMASMAGPEALEVTEYTRSPSSVVPAVVAPVSGIVPRFWNPHPVGGAARDSAWAGVTKAKTTSMAAKRIRTNASYKRAITALTVISRVVP